MPITIAVAAEPLAEPFSLAEAKAHLNVDATADDDLIQSLIVSAREAVEGARSEALVTRTYAFSLDRFPGCGGSHTETIGMLYLPRWPARKILSIEYVDAVGATQTLDPTDYQADLISTPPRLLPAWGKVWPVTRAVLNAVTVTYIAGIVTPFTADKDADTLTAEGHPYANGDRIRLSTSSGTVPAGLTFGKTYYAVNVDGDDLQLSLTKSGAAIDITENGSGLNFLGTAPAMQLAAMKLLIGHWYENREASTARGLEDLPNGLRMLVEQDRVRL